MSEHKPLFRQRTVTWIVRGVYMICALALLGEFFYQKHPYFEFDGLFGFYGLFGFIACVLLVLIAKLLRRLLMRGPHYYDVPQPSQQPDYRGDDDA